MDYFKLYPVPNGLTAGGAPAYISTPSRSQESNTFDVLVDHQLNSANLFFARYTYNNVGSNFRGRFPSDWVATYHATAAFNSGLDLEMPSGAYFNKETLLPLLPSGAISQATLDDKVSRILSVARLWKTPFRARRGVPCTVTRCDSSRVPEAVESGSIAEGGSPL